MTSKKITLTTDEARKRVEEWVSVRYPPKTHSEGVIKRAIEVYLEHFYKL